LVKAAAITISWIKEIKARSQQATRKVGLAGRFGTVFGTVFDAGVSVAFSLWDPIVRIKSVTFASACYISR
jgi:hypothetical protein